MTTNSSYSNVKMTLRISMQSKHIIIGDYYTLVSDSIQGAARGKAMNVLLNAFSKNEAIVLHSTTVLGDVSWISHGRFEEAALLLVSLSKIEFIQPISITVEEEKGIR